MGIYLPTTAVQRHPSRSTGESGRMLIGAAAHVSVIWASYVLGVAAFIAGLRQL